MELESKRKFGYYANSSILILSGIKFEEVKKNV